MFLIDIVITFFIKYELVGEVSLKSLL